MGALNLPSPWEGRSCTWMAKKVPTSSCPWEWPGQKWEVFLCLYLNWFHSFCIFTIWFCPMWHNREGNQNQPYLMLKKKKKLSNFWNTWYCCSVAQSYPTLCNPTDCSTPGCPVLHHLPELAQTHVHWVSDAIQSSSSVIPFSCLQSLPASGSFLMSWLFASGGQSIGVSVLTWVLPMHIQDWFSLEFTGLISLQSKGLPRVFSNTTVQKH